MVLGDISWIDIQSESCIKTTIWQTSWFKEKITMKEKDLKIPLSVHSMSFYCVKLPS